MKSKIINVFMFAAGAAIGSAVTWKVVKAQYERIVQEEIDSVKEAFNDMLAIRQDQDECEAEDEEEEKEEETEEGSTQINWSELEDLEEEDEEPEDYLNDYERLLNEYTSIKKGGAEDMTEDVIKVISPYDFGELDGYRQFELTYYADEILEDEDYEIVNNPEEILGPDALTSFGEYEEDAVFVRNDRLKADFQILKDPRTYAEARSIGPQSGE